MKAKTKKLKKNIWFRKIRGSYLPTSWQGLAIYFAYLLYIVFLPLAWYFDGYELWKLFVVVIPTILLTAAFTQFVASRTSK